LKHILHRLKLPFGRKQPTAPIPSPPDSIDHLDHSLSSFVIVSVLFFVFYIWAPKKDIDSRAGVWTRVLHHVHHRFKRTIHSTVGVISILVNLTELCKFFYFGGKQTDDMALLIITPAVINLLGLYTKYFQRRMKHLGSRVYIYNRNSLWVLNLAATCFSEFTSAKGPVSITESFRGALNGELAKICSVICLILPIVIAAHLTWEHCMRYLWVEGTWPGTGYTYITCAVPVWLALMGVLSYAEYPGLGSALYATNIWVLVNLQLNMICLSLFGLGGTISEKAKVTGNILQWAVIWPIGLAAIITVTFGWKTAFMAYMLLGTVYVPLNRFDKHYFKTYLEKRWK